MDIDDEDLEEDDDMKFDDDEEDQYKLIDVHINFQVAVTNLIIALLSTHRTKC